MTPTTTTAKENASLRALLNSLSCASISDIHITKYGYSNLLAQLPFNGGKLCNITNGSDKLLVVDTLLHNHKCLVITVNSTPVAFIYEKYIRIDIDWSNKKITDSAIPFLQLLSPVQFYKEKGKFFYSRSNSGCLPCITGGVGITILFPSTEETYEYFFKSFAHIEELVKEGIFDLKALASTGQYVSSKKDVLLRYYPKATIENYNGTSTNIEMEECYAIFHSSCDTAVVTFYDGLTMPLTEVNPDGRFTISALKVVQNYSHWKL